VSKPAIDHFVKEVHQIIDRFRFEYDINYAELIGALVLVVHDMSNENANTDDADNTSPEDL